MSIATTTNRSLLAGLYRALDPLCETWTGAHCLCAQRYDTASGATSARSGVYCLLAERTSVAIPADGGP
jgi:hypothetical protein